MTSSDSPSFTYSTDNPVTVTTDKKGNVYVGSSDSYPGYVTEFPQESNKPTASCAAPNQGLVTGVTVDKKGDVFIAAVQQSGSSALYEYLPPLRNCNSTVLPAPVNYSGGIELDNDGNLIVEEQTVGDILIVPYPYSNVKTRLPGFNGPYQLALNADNTLMFVAEFNTGVVAVAQYPSGKIEKTIDVENPGGVAVYPPPKPAAK